jgi:hypothetical protein
MKSFNTLRALIVLAVVAAPAVAFAHPVPSTHAHTLTAHDHTEQPHFKTISAHHTH